MPEINVQQFFKAAEDVRDADTTLKATAQGRVVTNESEKDAAPQDATGSQGVAPRDAARQTAAERKEGLKQLDTFWTAIAKSPLYGAASANHVKALFDDARSNADISLTVRFVRNVHYFLNEQVQMAIHDEVLDAHLIPPGRMNAFMHALINGKLNIGKDRAGATEQAVASFLRMTCLAPQELHLLRKPDSPEAQRAAIKIQLYDLQKNAALSQTLEECMEQGQNYGQAQATVLSRLHSQMQLLESLRPQTLESLSQSNRGDKLFRLMEGIVAAGHVPHHDADTLMQACLRCDAEGKAPGASEDMNHVLNTFQIIKQEREANPEQTDAALRRQVLASSPQVQSGMEQYLEKTYGPQENYTEAQRSEALRMASDVFSLANLEALNAAERSGLLKTDNPDLVQPMMQTVASMNAVVNTILDRDAQVDETLLRKMADLAESLYNTRLVTGIRDLGISPADLRRTLVQFCLDGKDIPKADLTPLLEKAQDRLRTLTASLDTIAAGVQAGALVSADLKRQGIFSVASRMLDNLRADFQALSGHPAPAPAQAPAPAPAPGLTPELAPRLGALHLAPATERKQRAESAVEALPTEARQALNALAPAVTTTYALPNAALKGMLADVQRSSPALAQVPLGNLSTVRLREALAQDLANVLNSGNAQNLSQAEWQSHIRAGVERYVQDLANVMRSIDEQPEVNPRQVARDRFKAEHGRESTPAESRELFAALPPYTVILTAAQKDIIKQALPLYGLRDANIVLDLVSNARSNAGRADLVLLLPNTDNMAYAIDHSVMRNMPAPLEKGTCPPQDMRDALDFLLDVSLHLHTDAGIGMAELQRRMDSSEVRSIGAQLVFLHRTFCGQDPAQQRLLAEGSSTALTATQVLESLYRVSHHYTGREVPDEPGRFLRDDSIQHMSQVDHRLYEMVRAPNSSVHTALRNADPPLDARQYTRLAELGNRLITSEKDTETVANLLGTCAHRLLLLPDGAALPAVWEAICGSPSESGLTEHNFASRMLDLLNAKAVSLSVNKECARMSGKGEEWLNYGMDPLALMRKTDRTFTVADYASATHLESRAITSSSTQVYQLAEDLPRVGRGTVYTVKSDTGDRSVECRANQNYTPADFQARIQDVVALAHHVCGDNALQSRMLVHLQTQAGGSVIDLLASFLDPTEQGGDLGITHCVAEKGEYGHVLLHIFNEQDSPIQYAKDWDISPDGTARVVRMDLARNPLYGTPLEKLPDARLYVEPLGSSAASVQAPETGPSPAPFPTVLRRELSSAEEVDTTLMVGQGQNTCFLSSIINGMLRTPEGRNALKQRFLNGNFMVDDPATEYTSQVAHSLAQVDNDAEATLKTLYDNAREQGIPRWQVDTTVQRFSPVEQALMDEYLKLDPTWSRGRMGVAQFAAPMLGFQMNEDFDTSIERNSPAEGSPPEDPNTRAVRNANWEMLEKATAGLAAKGSVPILYTGTAYGDFTTTGHYMAVVGTYGEKNRENGPFGLIVRDSLTNSTRSFPLDSLGMKPQYEDRRGLATDRVVLSTLVLRNENNN